MLLKKLTWKSTPREKMQYPVPLRAKLGRMLLATYFGAKNAGFNTFMIRNAVMSHNTDFTNNIQEILYDLDFEAIDLMLKNAVK